jgi:lipid-binding SYLF domain-containing protein
MKRKKLLTTVRLLGAIVAMVGVPLVQAGDYAELDRDGKRALQNLYASEPAAKELGRKAKAILVFPSMIKAGFMFGGQIGEGVLLRNGRPAGHYNSVAASWGLQVGAQKFGYALFFMNESALSYLDSSDGWELGVGPSIVVVDKGKGKSMTSTTLTHDVYAFIFSQKGLMGGLGVQGSKITKLD